MTLSPLTCPTCGQPAEHIQRRALGAAEACAGARILPASTHATLEAAISALTVSLLDHFDAMREIVSEAERTRVAAISYGIAWAGHFARMQSLPDGTLHAAHFDDLAHLGADLSGFARAAPEARTARTDLEAEK